MLSTQTRSSREATCVSELMPTWYLKLPTVCRWNVFCMTLVPSGRDRCFDAQALRDLRAPALLHPAVDLLGELDHLAHVRIEAEQAVGQAQRIAGVAQRAHAAHQVR